jgi:hypothetical protein
MRAQHVVGPQDGLSDALLGRRRILVEVSDGSSISRITLRALALATSPAR